MLHLTTISFLVFFLTLFLIIKALLPFCLWLCTQTQLQQSHKYGCVFASSHFKRLLFYIKNKKESRQTAHHWFLSASSHIPEELPPIASASRSSLSHERAASQPSNPPLLLTTVGRTRVGQPWPKPTMGYIQDRENSCQWPIINSMYVIFSYRMFETNVASAAFGFRPTFL